MVMDIKEFAAKWLKKKYPDDYATTIADDVLEFAQDWAEHVLDLLRKEFEDLTNEDAASWWYMIHLDDVIKDLKPETPSSEQ
jgi:hypothetical protein